MLIRYLYFIDSTDDDFSNRCIRPNKHKIPGFFDSETVSNQLKYTGVLETTKIRRLGYSYRVVFSEFVKRYSKLAYPLSPLKTITKESCIDILQKLGLENWKMGKTKIFFKYYHVKQLGQLSDNLFNKVVVIQCAVRRWLAHKEFNRQKKIFNEAAVILQKCKKDNPIFHGQLIWLNFI